MLLDLHIHTSRYSSCSRMTPEEMVYAARLFGLDGVVITEHNFAWDADEIQQLKQATGAGDLVILRGQEIRTYEHGQIQGDVLAFGFYDLVRGNISLAELIPMVQAAGGVLIAAHPFRSALGLGKAVYEFKLDGIEVYNSNHGVEENILARAAQEKLKLPGLGGSDAHSPAYVGNYLTRFEDRIETEAQLVEAIKLGRCRPVTYLEIQEDVKHARS